LIVSASLLTGIGTLWFARADDFTSLALARSMMGVAVACVYIPALVAFRCWFGEKLFGTATGALVAMGQLGAVCAATPFKLFVDARGWRNAFVPIGYASLLFALAGFFTILRTPQKNSSGQNAPATEKGAFLDPAFWALVAWFAVIGGTRMAFHGLWGTDFFTQVLEKTATHASLFLVWQSAGCMAGAIILGYASDFFGSVRTVVSSGIAMSALWGGLAFLGPETPGWIVGAFNLFLGVFGVGGATAGYSAMRLFSGENNSGLLTGVGNCALIGASAIFLQGAGYFMQIPWSLGEKYFFLLFFFAALCAASSLAFARLRPSNLR
jgi:predicted MFS family arabinose efflux permease